MNYFSKLAAKNGDRQRFQPLMGLIHGGGFSGACELKVLVLYEVNRISYSEIYPFLHYAESFKKYHNAEFRFVTTNAALEGFKKKHLDATHVLVQTWLTDPPERLARVRERLKDLPNVTRKVYLDSFANSDIRLARDLPEFDLYYKKSVLRDPADMLRSTYGHTTLSEYYGKLYGLDQTQTDWNVPPEFLKKLRVAPNFLTAPDLLEGFFGSEPPSQMEGRDIDVHARLGGVKQDGWYGTMRRAAQRKAEALDGLVVKSGTGISKSEFWSELRGSKVCFSPFGYGEICWRDIEAFMTGSVLLKPDMSHLQTEPDLFRDDETYVSVAWDFSDLEEKIRALLSDNARRERIAKTAWETAKRFLEQDGPVQSYSGIFAN